MPPVTSPYAQPIAQFIESIFPAYSKAFGLEKKFLETDLELGKRYGLLSYTGLKAKNPDLQQNTRTTYEGRSLGFDFLISSVTSSAISAQEEAITLLLSLDNGLPQMKNYLSGENTGIYDFHIQDEIYTITGQNTKPKTTNGKDTYLWYIDATCPVLAPNFILKSLEGGHRQPPVEALFPAPLPPVTSSPYIDGMKTVVRSVNEQFGKYLDLKPYTRLDIDAGALYGLMRVRSLRTEDGRRTANGNYQKMGLNVEFVIHAATNDGYVAAQASAGEMSVNLDNAIPAIKPLIEGDSTIYDLQPGSDIRVNIGRSLKPPHPHLVTASCSAVMPAIINKDRVGIHIPM